VKVVASRQKLSMPVSTWPMNSQLPSSGLALVLRIAYMRCWNSLSLISRLGAAAK
jgi:hypothetical protein